MPLSRTNLLITACAVMLVACGSDPASKPPGSIFLQDRFLQIAHRGGSLHRPENTLLAFDYSASLGVDVLELDVHATSDGVVVVCHDDDIARTTDGTGTIRNMTFEQLRQFDAAAKFAGDGSYPYAAQGTVIPTLAEVLTAHPDLAYSIDLKESSPVLVDAVLAVLEEQALPRTRVLLASPYEETLQALRQKAPDIPTSFALVELLTLYSADPEDDSYKPPAEVIQTPPSEDGVLFERAKHYNLKLQFWTINDGDEMRQLIHDGADGIITDDPDLLQKIAAELKP